jgi:hypothetical protein
VAALKVIGNAVTLYQAENQGRLPRKLEDLAEILGSPRFLICPSTRHVAGGFTNATTWSDYVLVDWPKRSSTNVIPSSYPLVYDRTLANHEGRGVNVLTINGKVEWDAGAENLKKFASENPAFDMPVPPRD